MKKNEYIAKYGEEAYEKQMKMSRDWRKAHPENSEKWRKQISDWRKAHPEKIKQYRRSYNQKTKQIEQMKKEAFIEEWGDENHSRLTKRACDWTLANPVKAEEYKRQYGLKGENYYLKKSICNFVGIIRLRKYVMNRYQKLWGKYKQFVAPASRLHYVWIPEIDVCKCVAVVETNQRQYPFEEAIHIPIIHRGRIARYLIAKHLLYKQLMPAFTDEELQAGVRV